MTTPAAMTTTRAMTTTTAMTKRERVYALVRCGDGRWLLLNRRYKPYLAGSREWVDYDLCDGIRVWLTDRHLRQVDGGNVRYRSGDGMVWLYHDGTSPNLNPAHYAAYLQRLAALDLFEEEVA